MKSKLDRYIDACNAEDGLYIRTCENCLQRIGEECGIDGHKADPDIEACDSYEESD